MAFLSFFFNYEPIHFAAEKGHYRVSQLLVAKGGIDLNYQTI